MDGYNWTIFALVLAPAMNYLLPTIGYQATSDNIAYYGQVSSAIFLLGWGFSVVWGPIADRFGRRPAMMGSILMYAVFTGLAGVATNLWEWNAFRFLCAIGIGGEWAMAGTLVAETVPEGVRARFGGLLHSAAYVGVLGASVVYLAAGQQLGWRGMFFLGLIPAVLVFVIRRGTAEPERWTAQDRATTSFREPLAEILRPPYRTRTAVNLLLLVICVLGLWASTTYVPTAMTSLAQREGFHGAAVTRLASLGSCIVAIFTIAGCVLVPWLAARLGRRGALAVLFGLMAFGIAGAYGVGYPLHSMSVFLVALPILGLGGANFAVFTVWLPEQYPTRTRATAFSLTTTLSRWVAAICTFLIGFGIHRSGSLAIPLSATAVPFVLGIGLVALAPETKDTALPD